jgi:hypothetical protein
MRNYFLYFILLFVSGCQSVGTHQIGIKNWLDNYRGYPISKLLKYPEAKITRYEELPDGRKYFVTTINYVEPSLHCEYVATAKQLAGKQGLDAWIVVDIELLSPCANWPSSR